MSDLISFFININYSTIICAAALIAALITIVISIFQADYSFGDIIENTSKLAFKIILLIIVCRELVKLAMTIVDSYT